MTGRAIDQVLPYPVPPCLYEPYVTSASEYVELAEAVHGPIPRPVGFAEIWGDALVEVRRRSPDFRIINLETAVTRSEDALPKGINYRMSPENFPCIAALGVDLCVLANNHVLDWGTRGLIDTLNTLRQAGIRAAGAGRDAAAAARPAELVSAKGVRLLVFAFGSAESGIPAGWAATEAQPGVNLLHDLSPRTARGLGERIRAVKKRGDIVLASIHWGSNWGYEIPRRHVDFAHALIDQAGVDLVHGHSSHHPRAIEVYSNRLVLYGCGDFYNDYEGIGGYEEFRGDLVLAYFPALRAGTGELARLDLVPFRMRKFRLDYAPPQDIEWLARTLDAQGERFGTGIAMDAAKNLTLRWA